MTILFWYLSHRGATCSRPQNVRCFRCCRPVAEPLYVHTYTHVYTYKELAAQKVTCNCGNTHQLLESPLEEGKLGLKTQRGAEMFGAKYNRMFYIPWQSRFTPTVQNHKLHSRLSVNITGEDTYVDKRRKLCCSQKFRKMERGWQIQ